MISIIMLVILGFIVGAFGTLIGIGGGVILIPIFLLGFHWASQYAIGTSLVIVFANALSGSIAYIKQKRVYYDAAIRFSIATLPGAVIGSYLVQYFTRGSFRITFGVLLIIIAILMFFRNSSGEIERKFDPKEFTYNRWLGSFVSLIVGFISSILGIGGGIIHMPAMVYLLRFPTHIAAATSHFVLAISTLFAVIAHLWLGNILFEPAMAISIGAVVGAQFGAKLSLKVKLQVILLLLALALLGLGIRLIWAAMEI